MVCNCGSGSEELAMSSMSRSGPMVCTVLYAVPGRAMVGARLWAVNAGRRGLVLPGLVNVKFESPAWTFAACYGP